MRSPWWPPPSRSRRSALTTPNTRDSGPRIETSAPMRAAERRGVVLVVVQRAPEHRAVDPDHPADGHGDVLDFVDRHVAVLVVVVKQLFSASAVQAKSIGQLGATGIGRRALMAGREFRGERTGRCEPREAVIAVDRSTRQRRAASIDGRRKRRRPVEMALSVMLEVCSGARVQARRGEDSLAGRAQQPHRPDRPRAQRAGRVAPAACCRATWRRQRDARGRPPPCGRTAVPVCSRSRIACHATAVGQPDASLPALPRR